jgi:hypothetical protein
MRKQRFQKMKNSSNLVAGCLSFRTQRSVLWGACWRCRVGTWAFVFTTVGQRSACSGAAPGRPRFESPPLMWRARAPPPPAPYIRKNVDFSGIGSCPCNFLSHSGPGRSVLQFFAGRMPFENYLKNTEK